MAQPFSTSGAEDSIVQRFEAQVQRNPDRLAIRSTHGQLTYAELNTLANQRAHALLERNLPPDQPVALLLEQGAAYVSALLGTLKAGLCYVPLDPANPPARNAQMLQDCGARCLVSSAGHIELARSIAREGTAILNVDELPRRAPSENPRVALSGDALAYVLYTSGSTGRPKGVVMDHRSVVHNVARHTQAFGITPEDRQTLLYTCSVYGGTRDIFNALLNGASLHTFPVKQLGVAGLSQWLRDSRITIYCSVATVFRQFVATLEGPERFPSLRLIKLGGEATHRRDVELYREHFPSSCVLHCGLGSTETGVVRHYFVDQHTDISKAVPLGYPIDDVEVMLLDEQGAPVSPGEVGEIVIRSRYIARGYWRRPDLNSTVLVTDARDPQIRLYRSGDLGVLRADGCLEHRGRKDFLVKVRGNRVELGEIESALRELDGIAHAAVAARLDRRNHNYIVAYFVANDEPPTTSALRAALAARLPDYMIPSVFMRLAALPQTPNGKIDRQALPEPDAGRPELEHAYVAPRTALESTLSVLWADLLDLDRVGVQDDFFDLGGDSLTAVTLMAHIRRQFDQMLPLASLFEFGTVGKLAAAISEKRQQPEWSPLVPIRTGGTRLPLFCIHPGGGNVLGYNEFIEHLDADQPVYGIQAYGVIEGQEPQSSIPEMASLYIETIRNVQPHGPYALGGESFGGLVAYEMACQLVAAGERVDLVFLGDVWPRPTAGQLRSVRYRLAVFTYLFSMTWAQWRAIVSRKLGLGSERIVVKRYLYADELHRRMSIAHRRGSHDLSPRPYPGKITLFRARDYDHRTSRLQHFFGDARMSWPQFVQGEVELHWMPGWHGDMMHNDNAKGFARTLQECLDRARAPATSASGAWQNEVPIMPAVSTIGVGVVSCGDRNIS